MIHEKLAQKVGNARAELGTGNPRNLKRIVPVPAPKNGLKMNHEMKPQSSTAGILYFLDITLRTTCW
jgi:hypothetical protein